MIKVQKDVSAIYLVGPTGVGKTAVSLDLAQKLNAEIVIADSMQVYRGLDIGTAKPTAEQRRRVPHHMLDVVNPLAEFNVAQFLKLAQNTLKEIQQRSRHGLIVGGTGLYIKVLIDGIFEGPSKDPQVRRRLEEEDSEILYDRLKNVDSVAASKIQSRNRRRVIRALEVYEMTGRPISEFQKEWGLPQSEACVIGLERERKDLYQKINERVDQMFELGLVSEVEVLLKRGVDQNLVVMQAIGYKEVMDYLKGRCTLEEAKTLIKQNTRHLAKRQMTWFRKDPRIHWFKFQLDEGCSEMAQRIFEFLYSRS